MVQTEKLKLPFGVYVGQAQNGQPHGQGEIRFNDDDVIVSARLTLFELMVGMVVMWTDLLYHS